MHARRLKRRSSNLKQRLGSIRCTKTRRREIMRQAVHDLSRWNEFFQLISWVDTPLWVQQIEAFHHLLRLRLISIAGGKKCTQEKTQRIVLAGVFICISRGGGKIALQVCGKKQIRVHPN